MVPLGSSYSSSEMYGSEATTGSHQLKLLEWLVGWSLDWKLDLKVTESYMSIQTGPLHGCEYGSYIIHCKSLFLIHFLGVIYSRVRDERKVLETYTHLQKYRPPCTSLDKVLTLSSWLSCPQEGHFGKDIGDGFIDSTSLHFFAQYIKQSFYSSF